MKDWKKIIYCLLPLQMIVLLLSPRFGWSIHNADAALLSYKGLSYENGTFQRIYQNGDNSVGIRYNHPFSKKFTIIVNDIDEYSLEVKIDGASVESEPNILPGIASDIIWKDTYGILFWRCILTITMTLISMKVFGWANTAGDTKKVHYAAATVIYLFSILISLRIIF